MPEGIVYRCANPLVLRVEPMQPPLWKTYPSLAVGSTEGSWKSEVVDYMARIRDKMTCDEKTRTFALEKTAGLKTDAEKARALAEAVQKNVRYIAIEFGRRGIIPTSPGETLANGYGDCKDGATLLKALLGVCGIDSRLALVRPEGWIYKETPSLDQFTHVIVHVPSLNAFIDPSDKYLDPLAVTPLAMLSTEALALDAEHPDFIRGSMGSTGNKFEIERRVTVGASDIVVDEVVKMSGYAAGAFRGAFAAGPASNRKAEFEKFLFRQNGAVELREMKPENVEDVSKPLVLTSKFVIRRAGAKNSSQFKAVGSWEDYYLSPEPASDRKSSFERVAPVDVLCDLTVQGERDLNMTSAVQPAVSGKFGNGDSVVANENGRVHIRSSIHLNPGEFPAGEYGEYTGFMARLLDLVQPQIEVNGAGKL
jgi:hypothetical protein